VKIKFCAFLNPALDGASCCGHHIPEKIASNTQFIRISMGSIAILDKMVKRKFSSPAESQTLFFQPVASQFSE
jgi:hypothetical protein